MRTLPIAIDFERLAGRRIAILGGGASAFDNAATALEAGAARVDVLLRRTDIPRINPYLWTNFAGVLGHFAEMDDLQRWRFARHILRGPSQPAAAGNLLALPAISRIFPRERRWSWSHCGSTHEGIELDARTGTIGADLLIAATGVETDLRLRPELAAIAGKIALWRHRFVPPNGEECTVVGTTLSRSGFEFTEREPGTAAFGGTFTTLRSDRCRAWGLRVAPLPDALRGPAADRRARVRHFSGDAAAHYRALLAYDQPELASLDVPPRSRPGSDEPDFVRR